MRFCVGPCNNNKQIQNKLIKMDVSEFKGPCFQMSNEEKQKTWIHLISKRTADFTSTDDSRICSNHFHDEKPTMRNPNPTLYLTTQEYMNI